jgi:prevent-host-death family protein
MAITTVSSREFNHDIGKAKKSANHGPVFITDRGKPAYVLLTIEDYQAITGSDKNITDLLFMPEAAEIEIEFPRLTGSFYNKVDLA